MFPAHASEILAQKRVVTGPSYTTNLSTMGYNFFGLYFSLKLHLTTRLFKPFDLHLNE